MEFEDNLAELLQFSGLLENSDNHVLEEEHQESIRLHASENTAIHETEVAAKTFALVESENNIDYGNITGSTTILVLENNNVTDENNIHYDDNASLLLLGQNSGTEDSYLSFDTTLLEGNSYGGHENASVFPTLSAPEATQTNDTTSDDVENCILNPETKLLEPDPIQTRKKAIQHLINPVTGVLEEVVDVLESLESESANDLEIGQKIKKWKRKSKNTLKNHKMRPIPNCRCKCKEKINTDESRKVFTYFINLPSHTEQNIYLQGCLQDDLPRRYRPRSTEMSSEGAKIRRVFKYCVSVGSKSIIVCQQAFLAIHGIKRDRLKRKIQHKEKDIQDGRGRHANRRTDIKQNVSNKIN